MTTDSVSRPIRSKHRSHRMNPISLANLNPPWKPGERPNKGNPYPVSRHLKDLLCNEESGRQVAETMLKTATLPDSRGYSTALTQLLERTEGKVPSEVNLRALIVNVGDDYAREGLEAVRRELLERKERYLSEGKEGA